MDVLADVRAICIKHRDERKWPMLLKCRMDETLPADWHALIRTHFDVPPTAVIVAFIGQDAIFNARTGFVVTDQGVAWVSHYDGVVKALWFQPKGFMDWKDLASVTVEYTGSWLAGKDKEDIVFDKQRRYVSGGLPSKKNLYDLVIELQEWSRAFVRSAETASLPEVFVDFETEEEAWMVAFGDKSFGPYDVATIHSLQLSGQMAPATALVWKEGMAEWSSLASMPHLVAKKKSSPPALPQRTAVGNSPPPLPQRQEPAVKSPSVAKSPEGGAIDVNACPVDGLLALPGMTKSRAAAVALHRSKHEPIRSLDELGSLCGMKPHEVQRLKGKVSFGLGQAVAAASRRVVDF
jgi:DNA uptake protein ComE-like DNA-binding protein